MKLTTFFATACLAGLLTCLVTSCKKPTTEQNLTESKVAPEQASKKEVKSCCAGHPSPEAGEFSSDSIYQLNSTWKNALGKEINISDLGGKVQVITMGYSTCKFACPRLLADMQIIEAGLPEDVRGNTGFTFFSIDPKVDTPERLTEYRKENKIPQDRWTLLTSDTSNVQELAVVLGLKYRKVEDGDFAHSNLILVLNSQGEIIHRQEGLQADPTETIKAIKKLAHP